MDHVTDRNTIAALCVKRGGRLVFTPLFLQQGEQVEFPAVTNAEEGDVLLLEASGMNTLQLFRRNSVMNGIIHELDRLHVRFTFPVEVIREVDEILKDPGISDPVLADFTMLPFVTIDNENSRDLDQAVFVEKSDMGFLIYYAIADASYYVKNGSALFREALKRGATYYMPSFCVPMLPRALSEGIVSLNPGVERRALVFAMKIDHEGNSCGTECVRGRIHSRVKLSYDGVQRFYDGLVDDPAWNEFSGSLIALQDAGRILCERSSGRGVVGYDRYELNVEINNSGDALICSDEPRNDAARWNEQVSLLCNMEGARLSAEKLSGENNHGHPVFRVHEPPEAASLDRLTAIIRSLIEMHSLDPKVWAWDRDNETLAAYADRLPVSGAHSGITEAIIRQIILTNRKSVFSQVPGGHYGLKVRLYGRFSSPMREVVGIFSHKELLESLGLQAPAPDEQDVVTRETVINISNMARETQKKLDHYIDSIIIDQLFSPDITSPDDRRPVHGGTILGMKDSRMYVLLDSPRLEVKVYTEDIERQAGCTLSYEFHELKCADGSGNSCRFRAGDRVELKVIKKDELGKWRLMPVMRD